MLFDVCCFSYTELHVFIFEFVFGQLALGVPSALCTEGMA